MRRRSDVNGISATRGSCSLRSAGFNPTLVAATTSAPFGGVTLDLPAAVARDELRIRREHAGAQQLAQTWRRLDAAPPASRTSPAGSYPAPVSSRSCSSTKTCRTVISFLVSVPVLSEQMTDVLPSVSTIGSRRTSALRLTIRRTPIASEIVTTAGRASGTTATASAMPNMNMSITGRPRARPTTTTTRDDDQGRLAQRGTETIEVHLQRRPARLRPSPPSGRYDRTPSTCRSRRRRPGRGRGRRASPRTSCSSGRRATARSSSKRVGRFLDGRRFPVSAASSIARLTA